MRTSSKSGLFAILLAVASLGAAQLACSLLGGRSALQLPAAPDRGPSRRPAIPLLPDYGSPKNQGQDDSSQGNDSSSDQGESPVEPQFGVESLPCPPEGTVLALGFDHALTLNYGDVSMHHFLHQGWINLRVDDASGALVSVGSTSLKTSMEARMSAQCALSGEGSMIPNAHGNCVAGVVSLIIEENWLPLQGEMICVDEDGETETVPFDVPGLGMQTHSGPDGGGEIFYLVEGSEGYSSMRPFAEGEGYHTWTLYVTDIPTVPLVPED
jgi:hypothetical protein